MEGRYSGVLVEAPLRSRTLSSVNLTSVVVAKIIDDDGQDRMWGLRRRQAPGRGGGRGEKEQGGRASLSGAAAAGIGVGDYIVSVEGNVVSSKQELEEQIAMLTACEERR